MIEGLGPIDPTQMTQGFEQGRVDQLEDLARRGELRKAAQDFEAYFLSYLLKVMRETVPKGALTANRMGEMYYSFYDQEIGQRAAEAGGFGLSNYVLEAVARNEKLTH